MWRDNQLVGRLTKCLMSSLPEESYSVVDLTFLLVLDQGTGFVKIGRGGTNFPDHTFPSLGGRPLLRAEVRSGDVEIKD